MYDQCHEPQTRLLAVRPCFKIHLELISACRIANMVLEVKNPLSTQKQSN